MPDYLKPSMYRCKVARKNETLVAAFCLSIFAFPPHPYDNHVHKSVLRVLYSLGKLTFAGHGREFSLERNYVVRWCESKIIHSRSMNRNKILSYESFYLIDLVLIIYFILIYIF